MTILIFVTIRLKIEFINVKFVSTIKEHINKDFKIKVTLYTLQKIPILKTIIDNEKISKALKNEKIDKINKIEKEKITKENIKFEKDILGEIKKLNIELNEMDLKIDIGTENAAVTAFLIPVISTFIATFLSKKVTKYNKKQIFSITPVYIDQNLINIEFSGIFQIKMIHIINTICIVNKKKRKGEKDERTSNRRAYDYSYE